MAIIHVKDATYESLAKQAAEQAITVDEYVEPVLDKLAEMESATGQVQSSSVEDRRKAFSEWMSLAQKRANRYPPGFVADDSRESIYAGRGE